MKGWVTTSDRAVAVRARKQENRGSTAHQPPVGAKAESARAARIERDEDLLMATARLSLCSARQLRTLTGILLRTVTIPDGTKFGTRLAELARQEKPWHENNWVIMWGTVILMIADATDDGLPLDCLKVIREHVVAIAAPTTLREHVSECFVSRAWAGDSSIWKFAVSLELREVAQAVCRSLVASGATLRLGPPPRGPLERATALALATRVGSHSSSVSQSNQRHEH